MLDAMGQPWAGQLSQPSTEWRIHLDIYNQRADVLGVVHAHPVACSALACTRRSIPAFHYMVAMAGGREIPLAEYALFGSPELSNNVIRAIGHLNACLMANHGMVALGDSLDSAFDLALEVENMARQYCQALQLGDVQLLSDAEMDAVIERFKYYRQRAQPPYTG